MICLTKQNHGHFTRLESWQESYCYSLKLVMLALAPI